MVAGQIASGWVIGHLKLSIAEPLLASNLVLALFAAPLSRQRVTRAELIGAVILSAGVAARRPPCSRQREDRRRLVRRL
ncbi:MAG TPA: hypothetical protein VF256_10815 [Streptosporangiaceae bacterium]